MYLRREPHAFKVLFQSAPAQRLPGAVFIFSWNVVEAYGIFGR